MYNEFVNTMSQKPKIEQLVPVTAEVKKPRLLIVGIIYEPDPKELIELLLRRYGESVVYQALVENVACEMASPHGRHEGATDNAGALIDELQLIYNKARQASITRNWRDRGWRRGGV